MDIFGNVQKFSESCWKCLEVARTFLEIPVMTKKKCHAFDSEKVGRYTQSLYQLQLTSLGIRQYPIIGQDVLNTSEHC